MPNPEPELKFGSALLPNFGPNFRSGSQYFTLPHLFRRTPADSDRLRRTPADSSPSPICHLFVTFLLHPGFCGLCWTPADSGGLQRTPVDSSGLRWTPADSSRLQQTPADSSGLWGNRKVNKQKKVEVRELNQTSPRNLQSHNHEQLS